jgi:hypothetical protein
LSRLERIIRTLADDDLVVDGSLGQPKAHPMLEEARRHRALLERLLDSLGVPGEGEESSTPGPTRRARAAANARWGNA